LKMVNTMLARAALGIQMPEAAVSVKPPHLLSSSSFFGGDASSGRKLGAAAAAPVSFPHWVSSSSSRGGVKGAAVARSVEISSSSVVTVEPLERRTTSAAKETAGAAKQQEWRKWRVASVLGAEKEVAQPAIEPQKASADWSHLGFKGGKRMDLKKILILGAGMSLV
jgi:hypothetical protein